VSADQPATRRERRVSTFAGRRDARHRAQCGAALTTRRRNERIRAGAFAGVVAVVLAIGGYLAFADLFGQRGTGSTSEAIPVRLSMAGFTPGEIRIPAGETAVLELWTTDSAPHLENGVHTMISDDLGIHEQLAAAGAAGESRRLVEIRAPAAPGTYDIYCDTCCGGKASPSMHGKLIVEA
jgi:plastocyanin